LLNNIKIIKAVFLAIVILNFSNTSYCVFQGQEIMFEFLLEIRAITNDIQFDLAGKAKLNGETTTLMPRRIFASDTMVTNFSSEIANKLGYNSIKVNPNVDIFSVLNQNRQHQLGVFQGPTLLIANETQQLSGVINYSGNE
jgi:hypothetical protein